MADENVKPIGPTYIHGIGSSQAIDTAGEIVDLAGLDCSSLVGGSFNFEHNSSVPAAIVGKILEYKKIFSEADCEKDEHKYFWDKCKTPYLYVMGRLFDDKKPSAKEVAALFMDDAEHPDEPPSVGFSIEGSKINKSGIIVDKSIARRVTCTGTPANKTCVAEMIKNPDIKSSVDEDSIFKSEPSHTIELLQKAETGHERGIHASLAARTAPGSVNSKDKTLQGMSSMGYNVRNPRPTMVDPKVKASQKLEEQKRMPKPNLGKKEVPGSKIPAAQAAQSPSKAVKGAPGWSHTGGGNFSHPEHGIVSVVKQGPEFHVKHKGAIAGVGGKKGVFGSAQEAGKHAGEYMRSLGAGKTMGAEMHGRPSPSMAKAMTAGSGMAAPGNLVQGAALAPESVDKKMKKAQWLARAEEAYKAWEKREQFENFMAKHMPSLTKSEITVIGQTLALRKSLRAEKKLEKLMARDTENSWLDRSEKK